MVQGEKVKSPTDVMRCGSHELEWIDLAITSPLANQPVASIRSKCSRLSICVFRSCLDRASRHLINFIEFSIDISAIAMVENLIPSRPRTVH